MILSSTMRTLIGGTAPLSRPVGSFDVSGLGLRDTLWTALGRGEDVRKGGEAVRWGTSAGRGGVGIVGAAGIPFRCDFWDSGGKRSEMALGANLVIR